MIKFTKTNSDGTKQTFESPSILDVISVKTTQPESKNDNENRGARP